MHHNREIKAGNEKYARAIGLLSRQLSLRGWTAMPVVGMSCGGHVCDEKEYEGADNGAGISVTLLYLPGSKVMPFRVPDNMNESWRADDWAKAGLDPNAFTQTSLTPPYTPKDDAVIFLFGHPESSVFAKKVLEGLDFAFPRAKKVGALAGQALENHEPALIMLPKIEGANLNSEESACFDTGVVGLAISGNIAVDSVVAQGSRPIGPNFEVLETDLNGTVVTRMRDIRCVCMAAMSWLACSSSRPMTVASPPLVVCGRCHRATRGREKRQGAGGREKEERRRSRRHGGRRKKKEEEAGVRRCNKEQAPSSKRLGAPVPESPTCTRRRQARKHNESM